MSNTIAVISDIHGNSWALEAVINDIHKRGINKIINLGDSIYGPLDPIGTINILVKNKVISILGNEDRVIIEHLHTKTNNRILEHLGKYLHSIVIEWLQELLFDFNYEDNIYCCHGSPSNCSEYLLEKVYPNSVAIKSLIELEQELTNINQKIILCGHSHMPKLVEINKKIIVNPGSVGLQAYQDDQPFFHKMENFSPHARYSVIMYSNHSFKINQIAVPYEYEIPALIAIKNGFPDWSRWIESGRA